ncbi:ATP-dependent RNA helicase, partial [Kickxella alabastrina]
LNKISHERNWFKKNAAEMDIELDSDFMPSSDDERGSEINRSEKQEKMHIRTAKSRLNQMLSKKIMGRGISGRYLSSGIISDLADRLLDQKDAHAVFSTLRKESALETAKLKTDNRK